MLTPMTRFESFAWSIGDPDGGSDFLEGLHRLFDVSRGAPLIDSLRSAESLEVLLLVMRKMQLDDRSAASAGNRSDGGRRVPRARLDRTTTSSALRTTAVVDLCHATSNGLAVLPDSARTGPTARHSSSASTHLSSRALPLINAFTYSRPVRSILLSFFKHLTWPAIKWRRRWRPAVSTTCCGSKPMGVTPVASVRSTTASTRRNFIRSSFQSRRSDARVARSHRPAEGCRDVVVHVRESS